MASEMYNVKGHVVGFWVEWSKIRILRVEEMLNNVIINDVITMWKLINSTLQYEDCVICCVFKMVLGTKPLSLK